MNDIANRMFCVVALLCAAILCVAGCQTQASYIGKRDREIAKATEAIQAATTNDQKVAAYAARGDAYEDKARYSRISKLVNEEQYKQLFDHALEDYGRAIALDGNNADLYYRQGRLFYDRASQDMIYDQTPSQWLQPAKVNFARAAELNPKSAQAFDMLGLTDGALRDWTQAIADFEKEVALDPSNEFRVSDAYCNRGSVNMSDKKYDLAETDFTKSIALGNHADACSCDPYNQLMAIYLYQTHDEAKAQALAAKAKAANRWIAPDQIKALKANH